MKHSVRKKLLAAAGIAAAVAALCAGAFFWYVSDYYRAEDVALEVMARRSFALSIPMATPARQLRTRNTTQSTAMKATTTPTIKNMGRLLSCVKRSISIPPDFITLKRWCKYTSF